jgi:putative transcriptional regulator
VREFHPETESLAGSLLLAHPSLRDPNFRGTVVFLSMHDSENGAFGVVLNRPSGRRLNELMPDQDLGLLSMVPVYLGGPVAPDQLLLAAFRWDETPEGGSWSWRHDLTFESASELVQEEGTILRVFAGYSGWSKGQLEREMQHKTWVSHEPGAEILEPELLDVLWKGLLSTHGPVFEFLVHTPENLGNN